MPANINISAQYTENGKAKGGRNFTVKVNSNSVMYTDNADIVSTIKTILKKYSQGWSGEYTYLSHEVDFFDIIVLSEDEFANELEIQLS